MWSTSKVQAIVKTVSAVSEATQILIALNGGDRSHEYQEGNQSQGCIVLVCLSHKKPSILTLDQVSHF